MSLHIRHPPRREWRRVTKIQKARTSDTGGEALRRLRSFLDAEEPQVVRILARLWEDQRQAITYAELRTAVLNGVIDEQTAQDWMNDYAHFFNEKLRPRMEDAMRTANEKLEADHPGLFFNAHAPAVQDWLSTRGGELITVIGGEQRRAINAMIARAYTGEWSVDELSRVIRPTIGLNRPQALANLNYYETVKKGLLENNPTMRQATAAKRAREAAVKYAERQHRYRAFMIARTEMAFAFNRGMDEGIKQAIAKGYMGPCVRIWATAADERMCPVCGGLEGTEIGMDGEYDFSRVNNRLPSGPTPPAHPNCRCAVDYREIAPPVFNPEAARYSNPQDADEPATDFHSSDAEEQGRGVGEAVPFQRDMRTTWAYRQAEYWDSNLYVSTKTHLDSPGIQKLNKRVTEAKQLMEISETCGIPFVVVADDEFSATGMIASYNSGLNAIFLSKSLLDDEQCILKQAECACPENPLSTLVHELYHWMDAEEYRKLFPKKQVSGEEYRQYWRQVSDMLWNAIASSGIRPENISRYALHSSLDNDWEEVYTEYRTWALLRGRMT